MVTFPDLVGYRAVHRHWSIALTRRALCYALGHRYYLVAAHRTLHVCGRCGRTWPA